MKKIFMIMAAIMLLGTTEANAQGFLKKLKQKAQQVAMGNSEKAEEEVLTQKVESGDASNLAIAQGSDIIPKRRTSTVTWDGVLTPSMASTAEALMNELPPLPSAEKMAKSTMEERDAYAQKIAAVVVRADQLQREQSGCSDAEMEALRQKWEGKIQNQFGLTKAELAILNDENAPESKKKPIQDKVMAKVLGGNVNTMDLEKFEKMSEKEQEAYIKAHPEFIQQMQKMAMNASNFSKQTQDMTKAFSGYEAQVGRLTNNYQHQMMEEAKHDYSAIAKKYEGKLQKIYDQICEEDDASKIDALYADADQLLYNYRLEAAKEYRASLQRQIANVKKYAEEFNKLSQRLVDLGELPQCAVGRTDLNAVIMVGCLLDDAYKDLPDFTSLRGFCAETVFELPKEGWRFAAWECRGYIQNINNATCEWPLLATRDTVGDKLEYGVLECDKFRTISDSELESINKKVDQRLKQQKQGVNKPPYGVYKSRSGKRQVEYSQTGEIIINGMTTCTPIAFENKSDHLEWVMIDDNKILKCTYKL